MIWLFEKPFRSIAPDGQATVHAPQPWHTASFTEATRRTWTVRSGILNSLSTYVIAPYGHTFSQEEQPLHIISSECATHGLQVSLSLASRPMTFAAAAPA